MNKLYNILQLPHVNRSHLKNSLSAADLHIVVMGEPYVGIVHPCKVYGIMKIGRPFVYIGPKESSVGQLISSEALGYHVDHGDAEKLVEIIQKVRNLNSGEKERIAWQSSRTAAEFSRQKLSFRLTDVVLGCTETSGR